MRLSPDNRKIASLCFGIVLFFAGCSDEETQDALNVTGTWRASVTFQSCAPADVCDDAGFSQGSILTAVMTLNQNQPNETEVDGTYTYEGSGISANIEGSLGGNVLALNGAATNPLGSITVQFGGTVSGDVISATVIHQINLIDGRSANVNGIGTFNR